MVLNRQMNLGQIALAGFFTRHLTSLLRGRAAHYGGGHLAVVLAAFRARVGSAGYAPAGASRTLATVVFGHICGEREDMGASGLDPGQHIPHIHAPSGALAQRQPTRLARAALLYL